MAQKVTLSFKRNTPKWVKWVYRIIFAISTAATFVISADPHIDAELKVRLGVYIQGFQMLAYFIGQGVGVKTDKPDTDHPLN